MIPIRQNKQNSTEFKNSTASTEYIFFLLVIIISDINSSK